MTKHPKLVAVRRSPGPQLPIPLHQAPASRAYLERANAQLMVDGTLALHYTTAAGNPRPTSTDTSQPEPAALPHAPTATATTPAPGASASATTGAAASVSSGASTSPSSGIAAPTATAQSEAVCAAPTSPATTSEPTTPTIAETTTALPTGSHTTAGPHAPADPSTAAATGPGTATAAQSLAATADGTSAATAGGSDAAPAGGVGTAPAAQPHTEAAGVASTATVAVGQYGPNDVPLRPGQAGWMGLGPDEPPMKPLVRPVMPDAGAWGSRLAQAVAEVLAGDRPLSQLVRWTDAVVFAELSRRVRLLGMTTTAATRGTKERCSIRSIHVSSPVDAVAEISAHVRYGKRSRAMALRLEIHRGRWVCTALELG